MILKTDLWSIALVGRGKKHLLKELKAGETIGVRVTFAGGDVIQGVGMVQRTEGGAECAVEIRPTSNFTFTPVVRPSLDGE